MVRCYEHRIITYDQQDTLTSRLAIGLSNMACSAYSILGDLSGQ